MDKYCVKVLGTPVSSIIMTEDRKIFADKLAEINMSVAPSEATYSVDQVIIFISDKFLTISHPH